MFRDKLRAIFWGILGFLTYLPGHLGAQEIMINFPFHVLNPTGDVVRDALYAELRQDTINRMKNFARDEGYASFPRIFSQFYGEATSLTNHLTYPLGHGVMGRPGNIILGTGVGSTLIPAEVLLEEVENVSIRNAIPLRLFTLGVGFNTGFSFSKKVDLRVSFFPLANVLLPDAVGTESFDLSFRKTILRTTVAYQIIDNAFGHIGLALNTYFGYTNGAIRIDLPRARRVQNIALGDDTIRLEVSGAQIDSKWNYYSFGTELRMSYDLFILHPYIGFGVGFEGGQFSSDLSLRSGFSGDLSFTNSATGLVENLVLNESGEVIIRDSQRADAFPFRLIAGIKVDLRNIFVTAETQYLPLTRVTGISAGVEIVF